MDSAQWMKALLPKATTLAKVPSHVGDASSGQVNGPKAWSQRVSRSASTYRLFLATVILSYISMTSTSFPRGHAESQTRRVSLTAVSWDGIETYLSHLQPRRWPLVPKRYRLLANGSRSNYSSIERRPRNVKSGDHLWALHALEVRTMF